MAHGDGSSAGSFGHDLDWLLQDLSKPAIIELGKPPPVDKYLPLKRAAKCPETHNRILFDGSAKADAKAASRLPFLPFYAMR